METIKNAAAYIYGSNQTQPTEPGAEPVSGEAGKGTATEPYDKGNEEPSIASDKPSTASDAAEAPKAESAELKTGLTGVQDESQTASNASLEDLYVTGNKRYRGGRQVSYFNPSIAGSEPKPSVSTSTEPNPTDANPAGGNLTQSAGGSAPSHVAGTGAGSGATDPAAGADPASGQKPIQKQQGADRPTEGPTGEQADAVAEKKDEGEEILKKRDPNDHSGEPMKMHDGSEENVDKKDDEHPGQEGGKKHGSVGGTGEEWIKTSGLKADGGDFDASKAGAGREADRLLEQKGIVRDERGGMVGKDGEPVDPTDHTSPSPSGGHSKVKTLDKIKQKLHIGTGKTLE